MNHNSTLTPAQRKRCEENRRIALSKKAAVEVGTNRIPTPEEIARCEEKRRNSISRREKSNTDLTGSGKKILKHFNNNGHSNENMKVLVLESTVNVDEFRRRKRESDFMKIFESVKCGLNYDKSHALVAGNRMSTYATVSCLIDKSTYATVSCLIDKSTHATVSCLIDKSTYTTVSCLIDKSTYASASCLIDKSTYATVLCLIDKSTYASASCLIDKSTYTTVSCKSSREFHVIFSVMVPRDATISYFSPYCGMSTTPKKMFCPNCDTATIPPCAEGVRHNSDTRNLTGFHPEINLRYKSHFARSHCDHTPWRGGGVVQKFTGSCPWGHVYDAANRFR
ncbi:hypothetical protein Fcan01_24534 [Folsomia candida]|uniref:Uncharacterized protein n=1 Tax=Folsomia candida TaxID=158441 RepID=A0A226D6M7_FOLCA|nr:hypothetical protein Fcan01_24534 [Folsomia candida]